MGWRRSAEPATRRSRAAQRQKMERHTQTYVFGALHAEGDEDTIEVRILRPHEAYRRTRAAAAKDVSDDSPTDVQEVLR
jgi:hypothetical protein